MAAGPRHHAEPAEHAGTLTIIHRFGAKDVEKGLPQMIKAVRETGQQVLWVCDPMHGNTETSSGGLKTRRFENILKELELSFQVHEANGSFLGGVHIELTGEDVTECTAARAASRMPTRACVQVDGGPAPELRTGTGDGDAHRTSRPGTVIATLTACSTNA